MTKNEYLNLYTAKDLAQLLEQKAQKIKHLKDLIKTHEETIVARKEETENLKTKLKIADTLHLQASEKMEELRHAECNLCGVSIFEGYCSHCSSLK